MSLINCDKAHKTQGSELENQKLGFRLVRKVSWLVMIIVD
jgi:hypothetical protein